MQLVLIRSLTSVEKNFNVKLTKTEKSHNMRGETVNVMQNDPILSHDFSYFNYVLV